MARIRFRARILQVRKRNKGPGLDHVEASPHWQFILSNKLNH